MIRNNEAEFVLGDKQRTERALTVTIDNNEDALGKLEVLVEPNEARSSTCEQCVVEGY